MKTTLRNVMFIVCPIAIIVCLALGSDTAAIMLFSYLLWLDIIDRLEDL